MTDFGVKVDPLNAAITLIYKHGFKLKDKAVKEVTVANELPQLSRLLYTGSAWSTGKTDLEYSSVLLSKGFGDSKPVTNVKGNGKQAATDYAKKHRVDLAFDRFTIFPLSVKAQVATLNWANFYKVLDHQIGKLAKDYQLLQDTQAEARADRAAGKSAGKHRAEINRLHDKMSKTQLKLIDLVESHRKNYGRAYFQHFRVSRRDSHGAMKLGGPQNAHLTIDIDLLAHKPNNVLGVTVKIKWDEQIPVRKPKLMGATLEFRDGALVRCKGELGKVFEKFAKGRNADVSGATPKETTEQLEARLAALPAWQYLVKNPVPPVAGPSAPPVQPVAGPSAPAVQQVVGPSAPPAQPKQVGTRRRVERRKDAAEAARSHARRPRDVAS